MDRLEHCRYCYPRTFKACKKYNMSYVVDWAPLRTLDWLGGSVRTVWLSFPGA